MYFENSAITNKRKSSHLFLSGDSKTQMIFTLKQSVLEVRSILHTHPPFSLLEYSSLYLALCSSRRSFFWSSRDKANFRVNDRSSKVSFAVSAKIPDRGGEGGNPLQLFAEIFRQKKQPNKGRDTRAHLPCRLENAALLAACATFSREVLANKGCI